MACRRRHDTPAQCTPAMCQDHETHRLGPGGQGRTVEFFEVHRCTRVTTSFYRSNVSRQRNLQRLSVTDSEFDQALCENSEGSRGCKRSKRYLAVLVHGLFVLSHFQRPSKPSSNGTTATCDGERSQRLSHECRNSVPFGVVFVEHCWGNCGCTPKHLMPGGYGVNSGVSPEMER